MVPKPGQFARFATGKARPNIKAQRAKQKLAAEKLVKLKASLTTKLKAFKAEQMEIFAGAAETKPV